MVLYFALGTVFGVWCFGIWLWKSGPEVVFGVLSSVQNISPFHNPCADVTSASLPHTACVDVAQCARNVWLIRFTTDFGRRLNYLNAPTMISLKFDQ